MIGFASSFYPPLSKSHLKCVKEAFLDCEDKKVLPKPLKSMYKIGHYNNSEELAKNLKDFLSQTHDSKP